MDDVGWSADRQTDRQTDRQLRAASSAPVTLPSATRPPTLLPSSPPHPAFARLSPPHPSLSSFFTSTAATPPPRRRPPPPPPRAHALTNSDGKLSPGLWYIVSFSVARDGSTSMEPHYKSRALPASAKQGMHSMMPPLGPWQVEAYGTNPAPTSVRKMLSPLYDGSPQSRWVAKAKRQPASQPTRRRCDRSIDRSINRYLK